MKYDAIYRPWSAQLLGLPSGSRCCQIVIYNLHPTRPCVSGPGMGSRTFRVYLGLTVSGTRLDVIIGQSAGEGGRNQITGKERGQRHRHKSGHGPTCGPDRRVVWLYGQWPPHTGDRINKHIMTKIKQNVYHLNLIILTWLICVADIPGISCIWPYEM